MIVAVCNVTFTECFYKLNIFLHKLATQMAAEWRLWQPITSSGRRSIV